MALLLLLLSIHFNLPMYGNSDLIPVTNIILRQQLDLHTLNGLQRWKAKARVWFQVNQMG